MADYKKMLEDLIDTIIRENGSDLHFAVGRYPSIRVTGELIPLVKQSVLTQEDVLGMLEILLGDKEKYERFLKNQEIDFSYTFKLDTQTPR
jgi:twitching motility protein PilT